MDRNDKTALVTGGTGYIAGEVIDRLLADGWTVHATARSQAKGEAALRARWPEAGERLKVFAADLMSDTGWAEAVAGCSHVAHVASPIPAAPPKHEDDLIVPAREGTLRALRFAEAAGVRRFVQTSSMAAIAYGRSEKEYTVDESDWTDVDHADVYPYIKSKTLAERAAREWMAARDTAMEFVSINPSMVLGPVQNADFSASVEAIRQLMTGAMPMAPDLGFAIVDVRDLGELHVRCLTEPGLAGERFIAAGRFMKLIEIGEVLRQRLPREQTRKVPTRVMPGWMVSAASVFNPAVRSIRSELGKTRHADPSHTRERLGWQTRREEDTIVDTARSLVEKGVVAV